MGQDRVSVAEAVREGAAFTRWAWRRAGWVQLAAATGVTLLIMGLGAPSSPAGAWVWRVGLILSLAAWAPLWAGLHRLALGGGAAERLGRGGLRFGMAELRFLALAAAGLLAAALAGLCLVAASAVVFILFHDLGPVAVAPFGTVQGSFVIAAGVWLAGTAGVVYAVARLALAPAATVGRRRLVLTEAWELTRGRTGAVMGGWFLAQAPALLCLAVLALLETVERHSPLGTPPSGSLLEGLFPGLALGLATAFAQAPLTAGVLGFLYRVQRAETAVLAAPPQSVEERRFWPSEALSRGGFYG